MEHNAAIKIVINNYDKMLRKKIAENYIYISLLTSTLKNTFMWKKWVRVVG